MLRHLTLEVVMRRSAAVLVGLSVCATVILADNGRVPKELRAGDDAWDRGDYVIALQEYTRALNGPGGDAFLEHVALQTGELFETRELTRDGRNARFSPDGRYIAFETGLEVSRATVILRNDAALTKVAELPGVAATFAPHAAKVAYLELTAAGELTTAASALDTAPLTAANRNQLVQALTWLEMKHSRIVVRDLDTQKETELATPQLLKTGLAYAADGSRVFFLGGTERDLTRTDIFAVSERGGEPEQISDAGGLKGAPVVDPSGAALLYLIPAQNPLRPPQQPGAGRGGRGGAGAPGTGRGAGGGRGAEGGGGRGAEAGGGRGGGNLPASFAVVELATKRTTVVNGSSPSFSPSGRAYAYVARDGDSNAIMLRPVGGAPMAVRTTADRLDAPAVSLDDRRVAYQMMTRDDWEIYVSNADGSGERRLTREIQHDVAPRFVGNDRILEVIGEPRHRRSYLLDLATGDRTRLFHNNTVRTIAPEYQWAVSPDAARLLIGAERDGDTVSPERGVYLVELSRRITKEQLLARLAGNLKAEIALRANGTRLFQPIAADVKAVVDKALVGRVFEYEKALFDFDSKHISRPGNKRASEYLFETYKSFGYAPEYQSFETAGALDGKTANVIATLPGTANPELVYVVSSHYDSVAAGPGADDDTSGTAALLEAARVLAGHPMPATIIFASFTGEEAGLLGSREFVRRAVASGMKIVGALNNDMIGWQNDHRIDNTIRYSNPGIRDIQHAAAMLFTRLITYDALYYKSTDAAAYFDAYGDIVGGIGSYPVLGSPHYHQPHDLLEFENHQQITETSKTTVATLMLLASSPSRIKDLKVGLADRSATASWAPSPEKAVASYIVAYGPPADPLRRRLTVTAPRATIAGVEPGWIVSVKAVNARGLEGWDWARATAGAAK
jgi:Tol biopolymer transport system component